jgi:hypothetical protein
MFGIPPSIKTFKAVVTLVILLAAVYSFVREKISEVFAPVFVWATPTLRF